MAEIDIYAHIAYLESQYRDEKLEICAVLFGRQVHGERKRMEQVAAIVAEMAMTAGAIELLYREILKDNQDTPVPAPTTPTRSDTAV